MTGGAVPGPETGQERPAGFVPDERDVLDLLGYGATGRHPLEILGYPATTRGVRRFREERPSVYPQVHRLVARVVREAGSFPRSLTPEVRSDDVFLERGPDGAVVLHSFVEVGMSRFQRVSERFPALDDAVRALIALRASPDYVPLGPLPDGPA